LELLQAATAAAAGCMDRVEICELICTDEWTELDQKLDIVLLKGVGSQGNGIVAPRQVRVV